MPHILRETRRYLGLTLRLKPRERETELIQGMHGGIFYIGIRRWIYSRPMPADINQIIADRGRSCLTSAADLFAGKIGTESAFLRGSGDGTRPEPANSCFEHFFWNKMCMEQIETNARWLPLKAGYALAQHCGQPVLIRHRSRVILGGDRR